MTRRKPDETVFSASVSSDGRNSVRTRLPSKIYDHLGNPKKIQFVIRDDEIIVEVFVGKKTS
jgi:hypothetical protein